MSKNQAEVLLSLMGGFAISVINLITDGNYSNKMFFYFKYFGDFLPSIVFGTIFTYIFIKLWGKFNTKD